MALREKFKVRYNQDGEVIECEDEPNIWIDIAETKKDFRRRGRGRDFQRTIYTSKRNGPTRVYEEEPLEIKNADDESQVITFEKVIKKLKYNTGRGFSKQGKVVRFDNTEANQRRTIREQELSFNDGRIVVERILDIKHKSGRGSAFQAKRFQLKLNVEERENEIYHPDNVPCRTEEE